MIYTGLNNTGEVEAIYGHLNGVKSEVSEVYGSIGYNDPIFYNRKTLTGTSPLTFKGLGQPLKDYHIFGETVQNGTPSPDYPVDVQGVGEWDATEQQYKIPVTIGDTTTPIYIGADPLYRIGDYADEVDFANQQIIRRIDPTTMQPYATPITSTITVPQLTAAIGDNTLTVDTTVKPSAVSITGNIKPTGYGQLLDVNDVDIQDSTGDPVYIQG